MTCTYLCSIWHNVFIISFASGFERQVQRRLIVLPSTPDITAYWMWNEHGSNFVLYDIESSVDIEVAYASGSASVDLSKCPSRLPYTIDFRRMEQTRHAYNTRRKIQRRPLPAGYSLQTLLTLAPGLTGSASLASGGTTGTTASHGAGGGFAFPGYGIGPVPTPAAPVMMNPAMTAAHSLPPAGMVNFAPSVLPTGGHLTKSGGISTSSPFSLPGPTPSLSTTHMSKSGMASASTPALINSTTTGAAPSFPPGPGGHMGKSGGLVTSSLIPRGSSRANRAVGRKTVAVLGAIQPVSLPGHTAPVPSSISAAAGPITTTTAAVSPQKRRRKNKTASNLTGDASGAATSSLSSVAAASTSSGPSTSAAAVKMEKSRARRRRKEKKGAAAMSAGLKGYNDETSQFARKKKKLKKGEDGVSKLCVYH